MFVWGREKEREREKFTEEINSLQVELSMQKIFVASSLKVKSG